MMVLFVYSCYANASKLMWYGLVTIIIIIIIIFIYKVPVRIKLQGALLEHIRFKTFQD